jgi:hypothetical protein
MSAGAARREVNYRGYKIRLERRDVCWFVTLLPMRSELPSKSRSFRTMPQSERAALAQARKRIDRYSASLLGA